MVKFCEICFRQPKTPGALLLSSCRHLFCRSCASNLDQCSVCQAACNTVEIRPDTLAGSLKDYFVPAEKLLTKALKVAKFQRDKQDAFITHQLGTKVQKYEAKKKNIEKLKKHYQSLNAAVKEERALIRKLEEQRKSPGMLMASPNSPLLLHGQANSSQRKTVPMNIDRSPTTPSYEHSRVPEIGSLWSPQPSQDSNSSRRNRVGCIPSRRPSVSPIASFKKPDDLLSTAKAGIYNQTVHNIDRATQRPRKPVVMANKRGNDIERARNEMF